MKKGDVVYFNRRFGEIISVDDDYLSLIDVDNPGVTVGRVSKKDCITENSFWTGSALSESGIQY